MKHMWKRTLGILLAALLVLAPAQVAFAADTVAENGYVLDKTTRLIVDYTGPAGSIVIPEKIGGYTVLGIGGPNEIKEGVFEDKDITNVDLGKITSIGASAFRNNKIVSLKGGESVKTIGSEAFYGNILTYLELGQSVESVGIEAFKSNPLNNITLGFNLTSVGSDAFNPSPLVVAKQTINVPETVSSIIVVQSGAEIKEPIPDSQFIERLKAREVFAKNAELVVKRIYEIDNQGKITAYNGFGGIVNIPDTLQGKAVTAIGTAAFQNKKIEEVTIPVSVKTIEKAAFKSNPLTKITLQRGLESIGEEAFYSDDAPESQVFIPLSLTKITHGTDKVVTVNEDTVESMLNLHKVFPEETTYRIERTFDFDKTTNTINGYNGSATTVKIPDKIDGTAVKVIAKNAFYNRALAEVSLPNGLETIKEFAFASNKLTKIDIPNTVKTIELSAFRGNPFMEILLGNGLTSIGQYAFAPNDVSKPAAEVVKVEIPRSITKIVHDKGEQAVTTLNVIKELGEYDVFASNAELTLAVLKKSQERISGDNRYETAAKVSKETFDSSETVILASGENFPDALSASYLAGYEKAPILLTAKDKVPEVILKEIERLDADKVIIIGGENTISKDVKDSLEDDYEVRRIFGANRELTSLEIAKDVWNRVDWTRQEYVFFADSRDFPDSLSTGAYAMKNGWPIFLVDDTLEEEIVDFLKKANTTNGVIVGGLNSVSKETSDQIEKVIFVNRIAGPNRFVTSTLMAAKYADPDDTAVLTSGRSYPDALVAAVYADQNDAPLLLVDTDSMPANVKTYLDKEEILKGIVIGGKSSVTDQVMEYFK